MPNIIIRKSSESNSILSFITPWIARVLMIVIIIVIIVAVMNSLGGPAGDAAKSIFGLAEGLAKSLEGQLQTCGQAAPDSTTCTKNSDCVNSNCINGNCQQCQNNQDCKKIGDNYTCQSNKMCKPPGGIGGFFNSGCWIGFGVVGYIVLAFFIAPMLKIFFRNVGKSKLASDVEAVTGEDATDGIPFDEIVEKAKKVSKKATEDELEKRQENARNGTEGKKLPYEENGKWYNENGEEMVDPGAIQDAKDKISKFKKTYEKSLRTKAIESATNRRMTKNGLRKATTIAEANELRKSNEIAQKETREMADEESKNDDDMPDGKDIEEAADGIESPVEG